MTAAAKRRWAEWEDEYLRKNWPDKSDEEIAKDLGRTETAVNVRRYHIGITVNPEAWSAEEDAYILEHWKEQTDAEMAAELNRTPHAVYKRGVSLGLTKRNPNVKGWRAWKPEEIDYLCEKWGSVSVGHMAKKLDRTESAVLSKVQHLGLGRFLDGGEYVTLNQLLVAVTGTKSAYSYKQISWVEKRGMPVHYRRVKENRVKVVYIDEFWEWAEKNRSFLDFSKMEPLALGAEPEWVAEQRKKDFQAFALQRKDPWTPEDDSRLIYLVKQHKYGYVELSEMLRRSAGAIQRRCTDLGIKERPVKAECHGKEAAWSDKDFQILADGIRRGDSYMQIGRLLGKSEKAIRGKVYYTYLTESADKIRAMIGNGPWGYGAPVPTVKQAVCLARTRAATKRDLERLCGVLQYRAQQLKGRDYDRYFQRAMCVNWDDIHGRCKAECDDCDSCTEFIRIKPQYCVRCGATFFERAENRVCAPCRAARKRQAYKKYRHLYGGKK